MLKVCGIKSGACRIALRGGVWGYINKGGGYINKGGGGYINKGVGGKHSKSGTLKVRMQEYSPVRDL